jgi:hypothetical protein
MKDLVLGVREDEGCKTHAGEQFDVVLLVRPDGSPTTGLALERSPLVLEEDEKIWNSLQVCRVVLQNYASWEHGSQIFDKLGLESTFGVNLFTSLTRQRYLIPSIRR